MAIPLERIAGMPAFCSYYPMPPARYRNARFQFVYFRADRAAVDRVLPDCFAPAEDGFCAAMAVSVPWSANYGAFDETALIVRCTWRGQVGYFAVAVFLNSRSSIPAGREIYGTPKVYAEVRMGLDERVVHTDTVLAGTSVLSLRSTFEREARLEEMPLLQPAWRLKAIPRADGAGAEVLQLVDVSGVTVNATVHLCRAGAGVVQMNPSPVYDLSDFEPREHLGAHYLEMDYTEGWARIAHDFLQP